MISDIRESGKPYFGTEIVCRSFLCPTKDLLLKMFKNGANESIYICDCADGGSPALKQKTTLTENDIRFLDMLYGDVQGENLFGGVCCLGKASKHLPAYWLGKEKRFSEYVSDIYQIPGRDYYYIKQPSTRPCKHSSAEIYCLSNIIIDLDDHREKGDVWTLDKGKDLLEDVTKWLDDMYLDGPNAVVATGRGYHLCWHYRSYAVSFKNTLNDVTDVLLNAVEFFLSLHQGDYHGLKADKAASKRVQGLYRLPGTYNRKAGVYAHAYVANESPLELPVGSTLCPSLRTEKPKKDGTQKCCNYDTKALGFHRQHILEQLASIREGIKVGHRQDFLFLLIQSLKTAGLAEKSIEEYVRKANESYLDPPFNTRELNNILYWGWRKTYAYSNKLIKEQLSITETEARQIGLNMSHTGHKSQNKSRDEKRRRAKEALDQKILGLYILGLPKAEIARLCGKARGTVSARLNELLA